MRVLRVVFASALALGGVLLASPAWCDTLGPLLPPRVMQAGVAWRTIERTVGYQPDYGDWKLQTIEQGDLAAFGRYGLTSNATFSFELGAAPGSMTVDADDDREGTMYVVGAALQLGIWTDGTYALSFGFHYGTMYWRNDERSSPDIEEQLLEWSFLVQRPWSAGVVDGVAWAGPLASNLSLRQQEPFPDNLQEPDEMYGGLAGVNARFHGHAGIEAQYLWIETSEVHVALFWQF